MSLTGLDTSWWVVPTVKWFVGLDSLGYFKSYWLWNDGSIRSGQIMLDCTNHDMVGNIGQLGHVKSYWLWHDGSIRSGKIMLDFINHDMVGQIGQFGSCQIILIMTSIRLGQIMLNCNNHEMVGHIVQFGSYQMCLLNTGPELFLVDISFSFASPPIYFRTKYPPYFRSWRYCWCVSIWSFLPPKIQLFAKSTVPRLSISKSMGGPNWSSSYSSTLKLYIISWAQNTPAFNSDSVTDNETVF